MTKSSKIPVVPLALWERLYDLADQVLKLAPWEWMYEDDIFGVRLPNGQTDFISIMGQLGEYHSIAIYQGEAAFFQFYDAHSCPNQEQIADIVLNTPQIHLSFEPRATLEKQDLSIIKQLGRKYRGKFWPQFRSLQPGYFHWFLTEAEASSLVIALEQLLEIAPRFEEDPALLAVEERQCLVRFQNPKTADWDEEICQIIPPPKPFTPVVIAPDFLHAMSQLPQNGVFEVDHFGFFNPIGEPGQRPMRAQCLLMVDADSEMVVGLELLESGSNIAKSAGKFPEQILRSFQKLGIRPRELLVANENLAVLLSTACRSLKIKVSLVDDLPALYEAKYDMYDNM